MGARSGGAAGVPARQSVRRTVDLSLAVHRDFDRWRHDTAVELGLTRVTGQELVDELLRDERLSTRIRTMIAASKEVH